MAGRLQEVVPKRPVAGRLRRVVPKPPVAGRLQEVVPKPPVAARQPVVVATGVKPSIGALTNLWAYSTDASVPSRGLSRQTARRVPVVRGRAQGRTVRAAVMVPPVLVGQMVLAQATVARPAA